MDTVSRVAACLGLLAAALGFSFLALMLTGGDSAFGSEPGWVYWPWMAALALTLVAVPALAVSASRFAVAAATAAALAYLATMVVWWAVLAG